MTNDQLQMLEVLELAAAHLAEENLKNQDVHKTRFFLCVGELAHRMLKMAPKEFA